MNNFFQFFSFSDYTDLCRYFNIKESEHERSRPCKEFYDKLSCYYDALYHYLQSRHQFQQLLKIQFSEGHDTSYQEVWNKFIDHESLESHEKTTLTRPFLSLLLQSIMQNRNNSVEQFLHYTRLNKELDQGNFEHYMLSSAVQECNICGSQFSLDFSQWNPTYVTFDENDEEVSNSCVKKGNVELKIHLSTGNLIVSDSINIPEFQEMINEQRNVNGSRFYKSRLETTTNLLDKYNFIQVFVGNNSPHIFRKNNDLVFGKDNESSTGKYTDCGYVCTDIWTVSIIEKEQLIKLLSERYGIEKAQHLVDDYLNNDSKHHMVSVPPAQYILNFNPDYQDFNRNLEKKTKNIDQYFSLRKDVSKKVLRNTI